MSAYSTKTEWHDGQWWASRGDMSAYSTKMDWHDGQWWVSLARDGQGVSFDEVMELGAVQKAVGGVTSEGAAVDAASPEGLTAQPE